MPALAVHLDSLGDDLFDVLEDIPARIRALEHLLPLLVNDLALLVHHVVVLDHVLASVEMHSLDLLLGACDRSRDPRVLDGFDLQAVHQAADPVGGGTEDLHKVVFERYEEPARPRVALAAGAPAKLVIDTPAFVALRADDVQTTDASHAWSENDVGSASGHGRGDRDPCRLPRLGDDRGLALVLLSVKDVVLHPAPLEHPRETFRLLHRDRADEHRSLLLIHLDDLIADRSELH